MIYFTNLSSSIDGPVVRMLVCRPGDEGLKPEWSNVLNGTKCACVCPTMDNGHVHLPPVVYLPSPDVYPPAQMSILPLQMSFLPLQMFILPPRCLSSSR